MKNYKIQKISKEAFINTPVSARLNYNFDSEGIHFYAIIGDNLQFFFSNSGTIDYDFAPYFMETHNILFVTFYEKIYALSIKTGQIKLAMELEYSLVGAERQGAEFIVITDASVIKIRIDEITDICFISEIISIFSIGGFITDYKINESGLLRLIHEDDSKTDIQLSPLNQIN